MKLAVLIIHGIGIPDPHFADGIIAELRDRLTGILGTDAAQVEQEGDWLNFYDASDIIGYPLRGINDIYRRAVTADKAVNVGNLLTSWNPLSHMEYWTDNDVTIPIAESLASFGAGAATQN